MHNNYYFLQKLSAALANLLLNAKISSCFSQEKDEVVIVFNKNEEDFYLKVALTTHFTLLSLPTTFHRAKTNSADVLQVLIGCEVIGARQHKNERSFEFLLTNSLTMVFKLYGRQGNILIYRGEHFLQAFNQKLKQDELIELHAHDRPIDQTLENFIDNEGQLNKIYPTLGKIALSTLPSSTAIDLQTQWNHVIDLVYKLETTSHYYIIELDEIPYLSLLPLGTVLFKTRNPIEATNLYAQAYLRDYQLSKEKKEAMAQLNKQIIRIDSYIKNANPKLEILKLGRKNDEIANIIMANLHQVPKGVSEVTLFDFYQEQEITIRLNKNLTPQANAHNYYKKSKNEWKEVEKLQETILLKQKQKSDLLETISAINNLNDLRELRQFVKGSTITSTSDKPNVNDLFKVFNYEGFVILVGKNSENNNILTQKYAFKDDIWLHARHVSGSHVVIKHQSGKTISLKIIEKAAEIAAYYSKSKSESLASVMYTFKKYVRKPKGSAPGAVVVDKEEVILVKPQLNLD